MQVFDFLRSENFLTKIFYFVAGILQIPQYSYFYPPQAYIAEKKVPTSSGHIRFL